MLRDADRTTKGNDGINEPCEMEPMGLAEPAEGTLCISSSVNMQNVVMKKALDKRDLHIYF